MTVPAVSDGYASIVHDRTRPVGLLAAPIVPISLGVSP